MRLGKRVKHAREKRGLTQEQLCAKVTGLTQPNLSAMEKRDSFRSIFAPKIAEALSVDLHWLSTGEGTSGLDADPAPPERDRMLEQLIDLWGQLSLEGRHTVLNHANYVHAQEHPQSSPSNPFGKRGKQPAKADK